jgi:hypothetical protein
VVDDIDRGSPPIESFFIERNVRMQLSPKQRRSSVILAFLAAAFAAAAFAQQPGATGGAVLASEPGKAVVARAAEMSAQVVGIDPATRTLTLKGPKGNVVDVVAATRSELRADQVGDFVFARYAEALTLELKKVKAGTGDVTVREEAAKAQPGEKPAVAGARQITAIATVTAVDPKKSTITLKGPRGKEVT